MIRRILWLTLLALLPLSASLAAQPAQPAQPESAPPALTPIERLAQAGRLWGVVRYLHPYLAYKEIDWDAALMTAIPKIRAASGAKEYGAAVQSMLAALDDPVTRVLEASPAATGEKKEPDLFRWLDGEVLYVNLRPEIDVMDPKVSQEGAGKLYPELQRARKVVIDLRSKPGELWLVSPFEVLKLTEPLVSRAATAPTQRYLQHSGYVGQTFAGSGGYSSGFVTLLAESFTPAAGATPRRAVFLVNPHSLIPNLALALQSSGDGAIVSAGGPLLEDGAVLTRMVELGAGVRAQVRLSELVPQAGWPGLHADLVVPEAEEVKSAEAGATDPALEAARRLALEAKPARKSASAPAPLPIGIQRSDKTYPEQQDPPLEMRLLAVVRLWNVIQLFYPYKHLIGDWDAVLPEFLAKMEAAQGARGYAWTLAEMAARVADGHTRISGHPELTELFGAAPQPVATRWIEDACVVTAIPEGASGPDGPAAKDSKDQKGEAPGVEIGDAVEAVDGKPIAARLAELRPYVTGATETALRTRLCGTALAGPKDSTAVLTLRGLQGELREARLQRGPWIRPKPAGEVVRILPGNIGYADLTRLTIAEVDGMFERLKETRAIVFDMRGYPRGTAWSIGPRINVNNARVAANFRRRIVSGGATGEEGEGGFYFSQPLGNATVPKYTRPTVMLIDERAISQSEHSGLFYEAANGTRFIGTPSAGSNGDVTDFTLPGGIGVFFTGHDVRHADGRQLQRVGLVPDLTVAPTRAGLHAGKDEVLERALQELERTLPPATAKP